MTTYATRFADALATARADIAAHPAPLAVVRPHRLPVESALDALADGGSLRAFCRSLGLTIAERLALWTALRTTHAEAFQRAREFAADMLADECLEIADGCAGNIEGARLRIDVRMRRCAALHPAVYGDRLHVEHSGNVELRIRGTP